MRKYLFKYKLSNFGLFLILALYTGASTATSITLAFTMDMLVKSDYQGFVHLMILQVSLFLAMLVFHYIKTVGKTKLIQMMSKDLRDDYAMAINHKPLSQFKEKSIGDHLSVMNNDIQLIESRGFEAFYSIVETIFQALFALGGLTIFNIRIVVLTIVLTVLLTFLPRPFAKKMEVYMAGFSTANEALISGLSDQLEGYEALYYTGRKVTLRSQIQKVIDYFIRDKMKFTKKMTAVEIIMTMFSLFSQVAIILYAGLLILRGEMIVGAMLSVGNLCAITFNSLTTINQLRVSVQSSKALFKKFQAEENVSGETFSEQIKDVLVDHVGVTFGDNVVLKDLNMHLKKGGKYVIMGESGSGKSTLINVLLGNNKDYSGVVAYNDQAVKALDENTLLEQIAYVKNSTHIYHDTLRNNLTLFDPDVTDETLHAILEKVNLLSLWPRLDEQVQADALSEGQKQRIGIARALLKDKQFIIMDEAMANLDYSNAKSIEDDLLAQPDLTYVTITHHLREEVRDQFDAIYELKRVNKSDD